MARKYSPKAKGLLAFNIVSSIVALCTATILGLEASIPEQVSSLEVISKRAWHPCSQRSRCLPEWQTQCPFLSKLPVHNSYQNFTLCQLQRLHWYLGISTPSSTTPLHPHLYINAMSAGHNEPRLLYSVGNISAFHIQDGKETPLSQSGPQTLSLLMVPTSSPFADLSSTNPSSAAPEEDFYLHLHLPPELDLSLPATTQIYHQPPRSYLIPRWDLGPESGAFTRIEFPKLGTGPNRVTQEDIDTFETILAQCTAFLERASFPAGKEKKYNPADFAPGEGYVNSGLGDGHGHIVLIDEEDGSVVGELGEGFSVVEGKDVHAGSKSKGLLRYARKHGILLKYS